MHTRHPTEQTVTDEKLEKNYFRHRYVCVFCIVLYFMFYVYWKIYMSNLYILHIYCYHRLQRTNKEGTSSRERTAAFGLIMPGGPPPALPGDHSVLLPSIVSQTSMREWLLESFLFYFIETIKYRLLPLQTINLVWVQKQVPWISQWNQWGLRCVRLSKGSIKKSKDSCSKVQPTIVMRIIQ